MEVKAQEKISYSQPWVYPGFCTTIISQVDRLLTKFTVDLVVINLGSLYKIQAGNTIFFPVKGREQQWRRKGIKSAAAKVKWRSPPGRVRDGGAPLAQPGGMGAGSAVSSPMGVWGGAPEANAFCVEKHPPKRKNSTCF